MPDNNKLKKTYGRTMLVCAVMALISSGPLAFLVQYVSDRSAGMFLPAAVYYITTVISMIWVFLGAAVIASGSLRSMKKTAMISAAELFAIMTVCELLPYLISWIIVKESNLGDILLENAFNLINAFVSSVLRIALVFVACLIAKKAEEWKRGRLASWLAAAFIIAIPVMSELIWTTIPFLINSGHNLLVSQLPFIIAEYILYAAFFIMGMLVIRFFFSFEKKILANVAEK